MRLLGLAAFAAAFAVAGPAMAAALPFDPDVATREWLATMGPEATARSNAYFEGGYIIDFAGTALSILVAGVFLILGWARGVRSWLERTAQARKNRSKSRKLETFSAERKSRSR